MFAGAPEERYLDKFQHSETEGVDVYVHPSLEVEPDGMQISLDKWSFMKRLKVRGVSIKD